MNIMNNGRNGGATATHSWKATIADKRWARGALLIIMICAILLCNAAGAYAAPNTSNMPSPVEVETSPGIMAVGGDLDIDADEGGGAADAPVVVGGDSGMDLPGANNGDAAYKKISGEITMIDVWNDFQFIRVMNAEGGETDFVIDDSRTIFSDLAGLSDFSAVVIGEMVDAYYVEPLFITLQYPARYTADVIVCCDATNPGDVFVGIVDKEGRASDGSIVINVTEDARIIRASDSSAVDRSWLNNRAIIAYYAITTRSLPPIAIVQDVVVLDTKGVPVYVNGARLYNIEAYVRSDGIMMAPLRAIVEALGHTVDWDAERMRARVGVAIYVTIGSDDYEIGRAMPIKLGAAAELINDRTYAPLSFYESILNLRYDNSNGLINLIGE